MGVFRQEERRRAANPSRPRPDDDFPYGITDCDFVVWQPGGVWISRIPFDADYFEHDLKEKLRLFYFREFLPAVTDQYNGKLRMLETRPMHKIEVDI